VVQGKGARIITALPSPYGVIVRISRVIFRAAVAVTTAGLVTAVSVMPAADAAPSVSYVALGDSYSSGLGAGSYISSSGSCDRSTNAYPEQWAAANSPASFVSVACAGATTSDVISSQVSALSAATTLVSITIGGNDAGFANSDAAFTTTGDLKALPYWSAMIGYTHRWNEKFRSTLTYGYVNLDNSSGQADTFYHTTHYASANLVWQLRKRLSVGLEGLYGLKEVRSGVDSGDHWRVQLGMVYSLFD